MSDPHQNESTLSRLDLDRRRQHLSPEKQAELDHRVQAARASQDNKPVIPHHDQLDNAPLSFAQERIFFLQQLEPQNSVHNRPLALKLKGQFHKDILHQALKAIVQRHSVLRGKYALIEGIPRMMVKPYVEITILEYDLEPGDQDVRFHQALTLIVQEAQRPFRLLEELPWRFFLFKLSDEQHILLAVFHHIAFDGWSSQIFQRELAAFYTAILTNQDAHLPELTIQYPDFSAWQREKSNDNSMKQHLLFWKEHLAEISDPIDLSNTSSLVGRSASSGGKVVREISLSISTRINELCRFQRTTPFAVLFSAFNVLLHRYTGKTDWVIGTPVSNRVTLETEALIGCFLNTITLRVCIPEGTSFRQLLQTMTTEIQDALSHQQTPFERLVQELNPTRDLNRTTIFNILFNLENIPWSRKTEGALQIEELDFDSGHSQFDLNLEILPHAQGLRMVFTYKNEIFHRTFVERMADHFIRLLENITTDPDQQIEEIDFLSNGEINQLLEDFTRPVLPVKVNPEEILCLHQLFENQAARIPLATALVFGNSSMTYAELNTRANQIAHWLLSMGAQRDARIGIYLERSPDLVAAILGVLKAGMVYVPLDPRYPIARIESMILDSGIEQTITQSPLNHRLLNLAIETPCLDELFPVLRKTPQENLLIDREPGDPAYIIYTSGTTGKPKGILAPHRGVANYLVFLKKAFWVNENTVSLAISSISVDPHVRDLFGPLSCGGQVVLLSEVEAHDPQVMLKIILKRRINTILAVVPTLLRTLIDVAIAERITHDGLRLLCTGGEILTWQDCREARRVFGQNLQIVNQYAPSEFSMACTLYQVPRDIPDESECLAIGKPIANARAYILDAYKKPQPVGVIGEIYTAGWGVTKGYVNQPSLTAEHFLDDPFIKPLAERMYRTGDYGRYLPDGNIEFIGRRDFQVKIRGYRVELLEIEAVLISHYAVGKAVVTTWQRQPGEVELAAFLVINPSSPISREELRLWLAQKLMDFMIPSVFVFMEELPLTPSGKIDRKALPDVSIQTLQVEKEIRAQPLQTPTELALSQIWQEVLGIKPEDSSADFFALGGHSLLALRLFMKIEEGFRKTLPLAAIFQQPTLAGLARLLDETSIDAQDWIIGLKTDGDRRPVFFINTAYDFSAMFGQIHKALLNDQPFYMIQIPNPQQADQDIPWLAQQAIKTILKAQPHGPYLLGGYSFSGLLAYEMAVQLQEAGEEIALLVLIDTRIYRLPDYQRLLTSWQRVLYRLGFLIYALRLHLRNLHRLLPKQRWEYLSSRIRRQFIQPTPTGVSGEEGIWAEFRKLIPTFRVKAFHGKICLLRAEYLPDHELEPGWFFEQETLGWKRIPGLEVEIISIPGDHLSLLSEDNFNQLSQVLMQCIQNVNCGNLASTEENPDC
jgi:amino acid adenylation domain-containing protein